MTVSQLLPSLWIIKVVYRKQDQVLEDGLSELDLLNNQEYVKLMPTKAFKAPRPTILVISIAYGVILLVISPHAVLKSMEIPAIFTDKSLPLAE